MQHILVPVNFLDYGDNAAEYAVHLAATLGARITLFHTYHIPVTDPLVPSEYLMELSGAADATSKEKLEAMKAKLQQLEGAVGCEIDYETTMGFAADEILMAADRLKVDQILMGTRHSESAYRILMGSIIGKILETAKVPVLVIPANVTNYYPIKNIAFASEYNDYDDVKQINKALDFAKSINAKLTCVHIELSTDDENEAAKLVALNRQFHTEIADGNIIFDNIKATDIVDALDKYTQYHSIDMTVMVTHKRSFFVKLFDRSLTKKMAFRTEKPLVVFHG